MTRRPPPIPLAVLTGFLGAGKTTLLNRLLRDPDLAETVVIVNELGEIGLDHLLVETADDGMILLAAGCLCCTVRGDLVATLEDLLRRRDNGRMPAFDRVIVETTGLADPVPILQALIQHPYLSQRYAVDAVVAVVDALHAEATLDGHTEAVRQIALADRLVVTKTDLLPPDQAGRLEALEARLRHLAPGITTLRASATAPSAAELVGAGPYRLEDRPQTVQAWLRAEEVTGAFHDDGPHAHHHHHHHDASRHDAAIGAVCLTSTESLRRAALDLFLDLVGALPGEILRLKGIVALTEDPQRPLVLHGVRHSLHVPAMLAGWPGDDRRSRLVLIGQDLDWAAIARLWDAALGRPGIDRPDAAALADNPLSLRGA